MTTVGLLGVAHIHAPGFVKTLGERKDVRVKRVYDHDAARAKKSADLLPGSTVAASAEEILGDKEIDTIVCTSETNRHRELLIPAAKAGKHIFTDKPLGISGPDAAEIASAIEKAGVTFSTGYFMRGNPVYQFLRDKVKEGLFGKITRVRGSNCHMGALGGWFDTDWRWMADPKVAGCGGFGDLGTHLLDILIWILGDIDAVTATLDKGTARYGDCDELGEALLRFRGGAIGTLAASWDDLADPMTLMISGTEAYAAVIRGELFLTTKKLDGADGKTPWKAGLPEPLPHAFVLFLDAVAGRPSGPLVAPREAAYRNTVMDALYAAAAGRKWVDVR